MTQQNKIYMIFGSIILLLLLFAFDYKITKKYNKAANEFQDFQKKSSAYIKLKRLAGDANEKQHTMNRINVIFHPLIQEITKNSYIYDFKNLTEKKLKLIGKLLLNSKLAIKSLKIEKKSTRATLHVEFEI